MNIYEMLDAVRDLPAGDYAECGVWQGWMAEKISAGMNPYARLFLFDTFTGHGEPCRFDDAEKHPQGRYADTNWETVQKRIPKANLVIGDIRDNLDWAMDRKFRFVHIDLDHYEPTKCAAEFFKSRMVPGGIIRFDDYNHVETPGATKAVDEVFGKGKIIPNDYRWVNEA